MDRGFGDDTISILDEAVEIQQRIAECTVEEQMGLRSKKKASPHKVEDV